MASMCGSGKSHPAMSASSYYRPGAYPYQVQKQEYEFLNLPNTNLRLRSANARETSATRETPKHWEYDNRPDKQRKRQAEHFSEGKYNA
ncbi:hypothetical protein KM043_007772 [Ampulex compressa]|nr:hypothetical protein KM043_007772 [Ampulex compressa]